jgi:hypothetical protein
VRFEVLTAVSVDMGMWHYSLVVGTRILEESAATIL